MDLITVWFILVAVLWTGYFVLEGFDFGVGILAPVLSRDESERRQVLLTIGPVWDGNEVWLITAIGGMFAAFPAWYAGMLSHFYLAMMLVLVGLIVRGVGLEWRGKVTRPGGRMWCDTGILVGSLLPAFLWGGVFADVLFDSAAAALLGGVFSLVVFVLHGAVFVALKTEGEVRVRARRTALATVAVAVPLAAFALSAVPRGDALTALLVWASVTALAGAGVAVWRGREGWAFTATAGAIAGVSAAVFLALWPTPMPGINLLEAASAPYALTIMTWIAIAALPFILLYQGWTYWVFRKRLTRQPVTEPTAEVVPAKA
ncbi:cytochrome d ubiquinol oxidase subunit II [Sinosporangium siamense]|uniref:Cytochrome c oxidase assembly protein n=1 Tax=Sinosporangium siamense TaxID=1367973 RepID=A0A919V6K9_9ACTN|nr:cytochrome d ubiquinol oxidase subunit II [Sinosporangium siamense]GII92101.1 cytochrome c oxidase assembly protein [Sinosporangium siamense]